MDPNHDQRIADAQLIQHTRQDWPSATTARFLFLDDRLRRGPEGWRHRLALIVAAELSWFVDDRIGPDRLALWISPRLSGVQDDTVALARVGWAVRRLTGGPWAGDVSVRLP